MEHEQDERGREVADTSKDDVGDPVEGAGGRGEFDALGEDDHGPRKNEGKSVDVLGYHGGLERGLILFRLQVELAEDTEAVGKGQDAEARDARVESCKKIQKGDGGFVFGVLRQVDLDDEVDYGKERGDEGGGEDSSEL